MSFRIEKREAHADMAPANVVNAALYDKIHASHEMLQDIQKLGIQGNANHMTTPPQCMPDIYKKPNYIDAYINYYVNAKKHFAKYTNRETPEFMK